MTSRTSFHSDAQGPWPVIATLTLVSLFWLAAGFVGGMKMTDYKLAEAREQIAQYSTSLNDCLDAAEAAVGMLEGMVGWATNPQPAGVAEAADGP